MMTSSDFKERFKIENIELQKIIMKKINKNLEGEIMKKDVVKKFQEIAKNKGMALTQNDVDVILDVL